MTNLKLVFFITVAMVENLMAAGALATATLVLKMYADIGRNQGAGKRRDLP
jgi:hypothetical protein